ncbi:MAG: hypothetical protein JO247_18630 [Chloroflexi bacterium]|nr:hypothetical protein [Chloroflexota bacterium]
MQPSDRKVYQCQKKTAHGNAFGTRARAKRKAKWLKGSVGLDLVPYVCPVCRLYHLTTRRNEDKKHP